MPGKGRQNNGKQGVGGAVDGSVAASLLDMESL